jgi:hypothetical protein
LVSSANSDDQTRYPPVAVTTVCAAGLRSNRPWQSSIADVFSDLSQTEQIGPLFAGFQNDFYEFQKAA